MRIPLGFDRSAVGILNKAFWAIAGLAGLVVGWYGFSFVTASLTAKDALAARQSRENTLAETLSTKSDTDSTQLKHLSGMRASFVFQEQIERIAKENSCSVNRYQAGSSLKPLLSEANAANGWMQIDVNFNLSGSIRSITNTLRDLAATDIPFQLSTMDVSRTKLNAIGQAECSASLTVALVTRQEGV